MRLMLKDEIEYALYKITGVAVPYHKDVLPYLSRQIAREIGGDPGEVSMILTSRIKEIIREDVSSHFRRNDARGRNAASPGYACMDGMNHV